MNLKTRVYDVLEGSWDSDQLSKVVNGALCGLIIANVIVVVLESVPWIRAEWGDTFWTFELVSVVIFSIEYLLRLWSCTEDRSLRYRGPVKGRVRYILSPLAIIDLLAILPFVLAMMGGADLRFLRVFRLLRLLKLTRYFPALGMLGNVFYHQRKSLLSALFVTIVMLVAASSAMYLVEHRAQPDAFGSIPQAMWWGMATLTTVGYGDVYPITALGRLVGGIIAIVGISMFALPAAILASGFSEEIERRDFIINWSVVASLPVFERLNARQIADISRLLRHHTAIPGEIIFRRGDPADNVYFVRNGRVDIEFQDKTFHIDDGDFFGEIALLDGRRRTASARAVTSCDLLLLDRLDFHNLCEESPHIRDHFEEVAAGRLSELPRPGPNDPTQGA